MKKEYYLQIATDFMILALLITVMIVKETLL